MGDPIIKIQNINKVFTVGDQDLHILKDISVDIERDDFAIILGPSGCGKSTLLHTIIGLEEPTSGSLIFSGVDIYKGKTDDDRSVFRKTHIGMIYQQPNWVKALHVLDNVALPLEMLGEDKESARKKALSALGSVSMDEWAYHLPTSLSSGQQQRIALARALITDPEVIIADEPTGNLDYEAGQALMNLLKIYNTHFKKTVLMVTHDLEYLSFAKTAIKLFDGKLVGVYQDGDKDELQHNTKTKKLPEMALPDIAVNTAAIAKAQDEKSQANGVGKLNSSKVGQDDKQDLADFNKGFFQKQSLEKVATSGPKIKPKTPLAQKIIRIIKNIPSNIKGALILSKQIFVIVLLLTIYLIKLIIATVVKRLIPGFIINVVGKPLMQIDLLVTKWIDPSFSKTIPKIELISIAVKNMLAKKTRTAVTIGGMAVGIAAIVFLVSLGYGLQDVVISRVARLDEMKQADISPQTGGNVSLNDETIANFSRIPNVSMLMPLISVVGKISYQNSVTDVATYGVTSDYLKQSAVKPSFGTIFESNETVVSVNKSDLVDQGKVAGLSTENASVKVGEKISDVTFNITTNVWATVRSGPDLKSEILGFTKRVEGNLTGEEVWGVEDNWVKTKYSLWKEQSCSTIYNLDCADGKYLKIKDSLGTQIQQGGYVYNADLQISNRKLKPDNSTANVLGLSTDNNAKVNGQVLGVSDEQWVELPSESSTSSLEQVTTIELSPLAKKEAVVNVAMLKVLGIEPSEAVGKSFAVSYVVVGNLLNQDNEKVESAISDYKIIGVVPEDKTPYFYVPFIDLRSLGIASYSQLKLVVNDSANLAGVRNQVESLGYNTVSVSDTVAQIESLFSTLRTLLALVGSVALAVASLGMFNTLTVSLLERTREVGFLRAIGMTSSEVQELFLTESLTMMFFGGFGGIFAGLVFGKLASLIVSLIAARDNAGFLDISRLPLSFLLIVSGLALLVGIATGIYPARRAKKISALNALRYE